MHHVVVAIKTHQSAADTLQLSDIRFESEPEPADTMCAKAHLKKIHLTGFSDQIVVDVVGNLPESAIPVANHTHDVQHMLNAGCSDTVQQRQYPGSQPPLVPTHHVCRTNAHLCTPHKWISQVQNFFTPYMHV